MKLEHSPRTDRSTIRATGLLLALGIAGATAGFATERPWPPERPSRAEQPLAEDARRVFAKATATDPIGDTFGALADQLDIRRVTATIDGEDLVVEIDFETPIEPPSSNASNALSTFFVDIDIDQNGATGDVPFTDALSGSLDSGLGNEFYIEATGFSDTQAELFDDRTDTFVELVPMSFGSNAVTVRVPIARLGDDGLVDLAAVVGTIDEFTDKAPNMGSVSSAEDDTIASLRDGRFDVSVQWFLPPNVPDLRDARVSTLRTDDSANFFFRNPDNLEFLIKVLDACERNERFWVFFAGATNVGFTVTVEDRIGGETKTYTNPPGQRADAVTDTQAFATCP